MITAPAAVAGVMWCIAVLWTDSGGTVQRSWESFSTLGDCLKALPRYEARAKADFVAPGPVVCVQVRE